jgi:uncharacterized protein (TIGR02270 family)
MRAVADSHRAVPLQWSMLETHLEEACFLWGQWERALGAPDRDLSDVGVLEERRLAHVDALVLGGRRVAERLLLPVLEADEPETVGCAALALLLQEESAEGEQLVLGRFVEGTEEQRAGIRRALGLTGGSRLEGRLGALLESTPPEVQASILEVFGHWGVDPGPELPRLLVHEEPEVRAAALRAAHGAPARLDDKALELGLRSASPSVREAALEAGLVCSRKRAWAECRRQVTAREPGSGLAMRALAIFGGAGAQRLLLDALSTPEARRDVLRALGLLGTVEAARACLSLMREEGLARLAGEPFSTLTGLSLAGRFASAPSDSEEEEEVEEPGLERELPVPQVGEVEAWWAEQGRRFAPEGRYLAGQPFGQGVLLEVLREGSMYRRRGLALALALRTGGRWRVRTDAPTRTQYARLEAARRAPSHLFHRSMEGMYLG